MIKKLTILYLFLTFSSANAQNTSEWLTQVINSKYKFHLKDTIVVQFEEKFRFNDCLDLYSVPENICRYLLLHDSYDCRYNMRFFYSFYLSKDNNAILTFLSVGKFTNFLTLFNFTKTGKMLNKIDMEGSGVDAGSGSYIRTIRNDKRTFTVSTCEPADYTEICNETTYTIHSKGQVIKTKQRKFERKLE